jgi:hypothetical protein
MALNQPSNIGYLGYYINTNSNHKNGPKLSKIIPCTKWTIDYNFYG